MSGQLETDAEPMLEYGDLKNILLHISKELKSDHVDRIKFLLSGTVPKTKLDENNSIRRVFQTLEEMTLIKQSHPWLLIELLLEIDRDDLVADCFPRLDIAAKEANNQTGVLSTYRKTLYRIAIDLTKPHITDLMDQFKDIPKSVQEKTRTAFELFTFLEEKMFIHKDDTSKLQKSLKAIGRHDSAECLRKLGGDVTSQDPVITPEVHQDFSSNFHSGASSSNSYSDSTTFSGKLKMRTMDTFRLAQAGLSVGLIGRNGTGFRIGSKYILTAAHVLKLAFDVKGPISKESMQDHLQRQGLKIEFKLASQANERPMSFPLTSIAYYSDEMDFAIVELAPLDETTPMPLPLKFFFDNQGSENEKTFHFLGHDRVNEQQEVDLQCTTISSVAQFEAIYQRIKDTGLDVSLLDPFRHFGRKKHLIQFQGTFRFGGSGSPGVLIRDDQVKVFTMLLRGHFEYPGIPECLKIQEGLRMWAVKETLRSCDPELCADIFGNW